MTADQRIPAAAWSIQKARDTYNIAHWSNGYFDINAAGQLVCKPGYRDSGADRDTGPCRADLIGEPAIGSGNGIDEPFFNVTPIGTSGSAFGRPAVGTFGDQERNAFVGPGFWNVDASLFKRFQFGARALELRLEVVTLFNHVNLDNPNSEVGVPGNDNPNAGFITSTAFFGRVPQRNLQFGLRFLF